MGKVLDFSASRFLGEAKQFGLDSKQTNIFHAQACKITYITHNSISEGVDNIIWHAETAPEETPL